MIQNGSQYGDFAIPCEECGKRAYFDGVNEVKDVEEYECDDGHVTERPVLRNGNAND